MIHSGGPWRPLAGADLAWSEDGAPYSQRFSDGYSARGDELAEARYIFLDGNRLSERFALAHGPLFGVGELGFGTGANFLLTRDLFLQRAPATARLYYRSTELFPLRRHELEQALSRWPTLKDGSAELLQRYPPPVPGVHRRIFDGGRILLDLVLADATEAMADLESFESPCIDAWFLDGFAPSRNPAMWRGEAFSSLARLSRNGATLATFSTAGAVRRALQNAGFRVEKRPGFGRKREALSGQLEARAQRAPITLTPWDLPEGRDAVSDGATPGNRMPDDRTPANRTQDNLAPDDHTIVLGAGLAGAHAAAALARRGRRVTVLEAGRIAGRASGNSQGVLFTRLSHQRSPLLDFSLLSYLFASSLYAEYLRSGRLREGLDGALNGSLQCIPQRQDMKILETAIEAIPEFASALAGAAAGRHLGEALLEDALWLPDSGWLSPPAVCRALLHDPLIDVRENCGALQLRPNEGDAWEVYSGAAARIATAQTVVIAAGVGCRYLTESAALPLRAIRGQTTQIPTPAEGTLRASLCHSGYVSPARMGEHCIGATFQPGDEDLTLRNEDHRDNLRALAAALPGWKPFLDGLDPAQLDGRAELRCASPDYLPMVGPLAIETTFRDRFAPLAYDAKQVLTERGTYHRGLYVSTAYGSRGLSYAALGGEILAAQLCAEPLPISRELARAVAPARFLLRSIKRGNAVARAAAP